MTSQMFFKSLNSISLNINLNKLVFLFYFLSFGIYGSLTPSVYILNKNLIYHIFFEIFIIITPVIYYFYLCKFKKVLLNIYLDSKIILSSIFLLILFILVDLLPISYGLFSDEQSYVMSAHEHARKIIIKISNITPILDGFAINNITRFISFFLCCYIVLNFYIFKTQKLKLLLIYVCISLVLFRLIFINLGGYMSPHPTINLIPHLFTGTFLGFTPFVFKFSILTIFIIWLVLFFSKITKSDSWFFCVTLIILISTIPIITELKHTVEPSLWTFMLFTYVCISLSTNEYKNYNKMILIVISVCFLRQPAFLALIPIFISEAFYIYKRQINLNLLFLILKKYSPFILFMPYLINSIFLGTGPTAGMLDGPYQKFDHSYPNIKEIYNFISISIPQIYLLIIFVFFIFLLIKNVKKFSIFLIFIIFLTIIYYSIVSSLWGSAKYQAEYILPFFVLALIYFLKILKSFHQKIFVLFSIITVNLYFIKEPIWKKNFLKNYEVTVSKPEIYPGIQYFYGPFIKNLYKQNDLKNTLFFGSQYKLYPIFISGISVKDYKLVYDKNKNLKNLVYLKNNKWEINESNLFDINNIIIESVPQRNKLIEKLKYKSWTVKSILVNKTHQTKSFWLRKILN